jgi:hypothetical protein
MRIPYIQKEINCVQEMCWSLDGFILFGYYLQKTHGSGRDKYGFLYTGTDQTSEFIEHNNSAT